MFECPRCGEPSVSLMQKYRTGWWQITHCRDCQARLTTQPLVLGIIMFLYIWNVVWWVGMYVFTGNPMHFLYLILGWLVLDMINVTCIPLSVLKPRHTA